jgi:leucine efflux protein
MTIKYAGAAYLGWVGVQLLRSALRAPDASQRETAQPQVDSSQPLRKALFISLLNPKAILFFLSFFVQFVDPAYDHPGLSFLMLGAIAQTFSAIYLSSLIFAGAKLAAAFRARRRLSTALKTGVGALFLGFGAKLATASLG